EGQLFLGAVAATMVGIAFQLPPVIHVTLALAAAAAAGALGGAVPGLLKARWGANELVSSLMLNYVYYRLGIYIINYHFRDERAGAMVSLRLAESSWLHHFWPPTRLHGGLFIAIGAVLLTYVFLYHTRWGYALRMTGINASFAAYSGISVGLVIVYSQVLSGAVAGIAGGVEMLGILRRRRGVPGAQSPAAGAGGRRVPRVLAHRRRHHGPGDGHDRGDGDGHPERHDPFGHRPGLPAPVPSPGHRAGIPGGERLMDTLRAIFSAAFGYSLLRVSTPLLFASLAAVVSARAGVINIGIEGMMLAAAFAGVAVSAFTASPWLGLLGAVVTGIVMALILAYFALK